MHIFRILKKAAFDGHARKCLYKKAKSFLCVLLDPIVLSTPRLCGKEIIRTQL